MKMDDLTIEKGSKMSWNFFAAETAGCRMSIPVTVVNGSGDGPVLAVLAGCHPGEYNGIATSIRLAREVNPQTLSGTLLIVHVLNIMGFQFKTGHISPLDGINMGKAYPTQEEGDKDYGLVSHQGKSPTYQAADRVFKEIVMKSNYVIDLHGGEHYETLPPNIEIKPQGIADVDGKTRALARAFGFNLIWEVPLGSIPEMPGYPGRGSVTVEAPRRGIPAAVCEVGNEGRLEEELVDLTFKGMLNVMVSLGMIKGEKKIVEPTIAVGGHVLFSRFPGLVFSKVKAGDRVTKGEVLGHTMNLAGEIVEVFESPANGILMNVVTLGVTNPGDMRFVIGNLK